MPRTQRAPSPLLILSPPRLTELLPGEGGQDLGLRCSWLRVAAHKGRWGGRHMAPGRSRGGSHRGTCGDSPYFPSSLTGVLGAGFGVWASGSGECEMPPARPPFALMSASKSRNPVSPAQTRALGLSLLSLTSSGRWAGAGSQGRLVEGEDRGFPWGAAPRPGRRVLILHPPSVSVPRLSLAPGAPNP